MNTLSTALPPPADDRRRGRIGKRLLLAASHTLVLAFGFAAGIYTLPILTSPEGPAVGEVRKVASDARYRGEFRRGLPGSDPFHWGEGALSVGERAVTLEGKLAPGPDYKLYLVSGFVDTKEAFLRVKKRSPRLGDVKTFQNFIVPVPEGIDIEQYDTVLIWCERFSQFITAAKYR